MRVSPTRPDVAARSGGQVLVDALRIHGARTVYSVPGESFISVLEALHHARDEVRLVVTRQEGGAAHMAEAYGKLTGEPGICFVTRGPGTTNASIGIHTARQDSTPLIVFIGQVARDMVGREAWQEIDYRQMFGGIAKWVDQVDDPARIPEMVSRAFHVATSGRPGPVVLALPEDMLSETVSVPDCPSYVRSGAAPAPSAMQALSARLQAARRPLAIVGGGGWTREACEDLRAFAQAWDLPVAASFRRQDLVDNLDERYVGETGLGMDPKLAGRVAEADLILAIGPRLGETSTIGYTLYDIPKPRQALVHVHADPEELGHVYRADLPINASMPEFARAAKTMPPAVPVAWGEWRKAARADYLANGEAPAPPAEGVDLARVMIHLRETLPADTIVTNGAGNYTIWVQRFYRYRGWRTQLAPTSGTMGYGLPAAIAAKIEHPGRTVVCFAGDGCFLMNGQELATAMQAGANVIVIVVNNGIYGSIRMHQEKRYPGNVCGTDLHNPDFPALAMAYGAHGERVARTEDFPASFARARAAGRPALIELVTSAEAITPRLTISALRAAK